jgi:hypothetical protein
MKRMILIAALVCCRATKATTTREPAPSGGFWCSTGGAMLADTSGCFRTQALCEERRMQDDSACAYQAQAWCMVSQQADGTTYEPCTIDEAYCHEGEGYEQDDGATLLQGCTLTE